jgi:peroxiredoxin
MTRILFILLIAVAMFNDTDAQQDTTAVTKTGDKAPMFSCRGIDGKSYDLSQLKGKVIMLNFFATWCPGCNLELPELEKTIWKKHKSDPNFVLLVIGREHTEKDLKEFASQRGYDLPFVPDAGREIYGLYATKYIPRNIVIDRNGIIVYQKSGFTAKELQDIENLISEKLK